MRIRFTSPGTGWLHTNIDGFSGSSDRTIYVFRPGQELEIASFVHHVDGPGTTKRARLMAPCTLHLGVSINSDYIAEVPRSFFEVVEEPAVTHYDEDLDRTPELDALVQALNRPLDQ